MAHSNWSDVLLVQKPEPKGEFTKLVIPLKRAQNLMLVEAQVDSVLGYFILDTGAPYLVLNQTYFHDFNINPNQVAVGVTGEDEVQRTTTVQKLKIRDLYYENIEADLTDLSLIEDKRGVKILGLLGVNLFIQMEMEIDLANSVLTLHKLDRKGERLTEGMFEYDHELKMRLRNYAIAIPAGVGEKSLLFCFDTGAEIVVLGNDLSEAVYDKVEITGQKKLVGAGGEGIEVLFGNVENLDVGFPLSNLSVIITDLNAIGKSYGFRVDGIVGFDLLKQGVVCVNFRKGTIKLKEAKG